MGKSSTSERNRRINTAIELLDQKVSTIQIVVTLKKRYGISQRQAYRYLEKAQRATQNLPIPEAKVVFTVKLPKSLVHRVREFGTTSGHSFSDITTHALESYLSKGEKSG